LARLRKLAGGGARVGFLHGLRFAVRGPPGGPELLILHGLGDSIAGWARVLGPLSRTHRVHIVDLPGHGLSAPPADFRLGTLLEPVARYAAGLRSPVRIVWGERDGLLPAGTLPFFRAHLPRVEVVTLPHAGHLPHLEAPTELARAIALPLGGP